MRPARPRAAAHPRTADSAETNRLRRRSAVPGHVPDVRADPRPVPACAGRTPTSSWARAAPPASWQGHLARGAPRRFLCRHGRGAVPGGAEAERDGCSRVPRLSAGRRRPHSRRSHQPLVGHHLAPNPAGYRTRRPWSLPDRSSSRSTTRPSCSARASCRPSAPCVSGRCCTGPTSCRVASHCSACSALPCCWPPMPQSSGAPTAHSPRSRSSLRCRLPCGSWLWASGSLPRGSCQPLSMKRPTRTASPWLTANPCPARRARRTLPRLAGCSRRSFQDPT